MRVRKFAPVRFNWYAGCAWKGTAFGRVKGCSQLLGYVEQCLSDRISDWIARSHVPCPGEQIGTALDLMHEGKSIRSVIIF